MSATPNRWRTSAATRPGSRGVWLSLVVLALGCKRTPSDPKPAVEKREHAVSAAPMPMVDVHVHLSPSGTQRLLRIMQQRGIEHVVNLSGGDAYGGLSTQLKAAAATAGKVTVFATMPYAESRAPGFGERMASNLRLAHSMGARGYKIAKVFGLGMVDERGALIAVDDPELDVVFDAAGELDMPVAIHTGDPLRFWDPPSRQNERFAELSAHPGWSLYGRAVPSFAELYAALERRFARHPKTTFISVHFGNLAEDPKRVAETLRKYPNVYVDTAARVPEMGRHDPAMMRAFFEEFQDRILFGSDLGVGAEPAPLFLGSSGAKPPTRDEEERFFSATRRYFETSDQDFPHPTPIQGDWTISGIGLPKPILEKVFHGNAERLLHLKLHD